MDRIEAALLALKKLRAKVYVTGHLGRAGTLQDVQDNLDLFYDMRTTLLGIFKNADKNFALAVQTVGDKYADNKWLVFDTFERIQVRASSFRPATHWTPCLSVGSGTAYVRVEVSVGVSAHVLFCSKRAVTAHGRVGKPMHVSQRRAQLQSVSFSGQCPVGTRLHDAL
jgi:hypothetical protein